MRLWRTDRYPWYVEALGELTTILIHLAAFCLLSWLFSWQIPGWGWAIILLIAMNKWNQS